MSRVWLSIVMLAAACALADAADWPQWRGTDRSNVSTETGLAKKWPKAGPPLVWKATGLGDGVAPVSVAKGRVFTTGNVEKDVICTALSVKDGKEIWIAKLGPAARESSVMRWLAQAAPTVDGERVYAVTANGDYVCMAADTGKVIWRKHFLKDFHGKKQIWGFCDYPLVDGDTLVVCPGGDKNTVAGLNKKTGQVVWGCAIKGEFAAHSVLIGAELDGQRQYVVHMGTGLYGISTDGKLLWRYMSLSNGTANTHAPIAHDGFVFFANGYASGHALLKVVKKDEGWSAEQVYRGKGPYVSWLGSPTRIGDGVQINGAGGLVYVCSRLDDSGAMN